MAGYCRLIVCAASALLVLNTCNAFAQAYPTKPIRIVTGGTGGGGDFISRLLASGLAVTLGQQVIVDNRGGVVPGEIVSQAAPDGYTLLCYPGSLWIGPLLQKTPYEPLKDFAPVSMVVRSPSILVVHPSLPVRSVKELVALAKAKPGALNYSAAGTGGATLSPALTDVIGGQVHMTFGSAASVAPHMKSGRLRSLAVTSAQPSPLMPGLPTIAASGVPGYDSVQNIGLFAPVKTGEPIISRLNLEIIRMLRRSEMTEKLFAAGVESVGSSPGELAAVMKQEISRFGKVIRDAGIHAE